MFLKERILTAYQEFSFQVTFPHFPVATKKPRWNSLASFSQSINLSLKWLIPQERKVLPRKSKVHKKRLSMQKYLLTS